MLFNKSIPEDILVAPNTRKFVQVLDALQSCKQGIIANSVRANNPVLCNDEAWLLRQLEDLGFVGIPEGMPILILQQLALNANVIFNLRGSVLGLQVLCNAVTLGFVTVDFSDFIKPFKYLLPNSLLDGYLTSDSEQTSWRYLIDDNTLNEDRSLSVTINGGIVDELLIRRFLESSIKSYISFQPSFTLHLDFAGPLFNIPKVFHERLNKVFLNKGSYVYFNRPDGSIHEEDIIIL